MIGGIVNKTREDEREERKREREEERERPSVCAFNTSPCVRSKCPRVYRQHAHMFYTCGHVAGTHGDILNAHTGTC